MEDKLLIFNKAIPTTATDSGYKGNVDVVAFKVSSLSHMVGFKNSSNESIVRLFFRGSSHVDGPTVVNHSSHDHVWYKSYVDIKTADDGQNEFIYQFVKRITGEKSPIIRFDQVNDIYGASGLYRGGDFIESIKLTEIPVEVSVASEPVP